MTGHVLLAALLLLSAPAHALDCTQPSVEASHDAAALIFEGRPLDEGQDVPAFEGARQSRRYVFRVDRMWKGPASLKRISIDRDVYWGDRFRAPTSYLPTSYLGVAEKQGDHHVAHICGRTQPLDRAGDMLDYLKARAAKPKRP